MLLILLAGCASKSLVRSEAQWEAEPAQQQATVGQAQSQEAPQEFGQQDSAPQQQAEEPTPEEVQQQERQRKVMELRARREMVQRQRDVSKGMIFEYLPGEPCHVGGRGASGIGGVLELPLGQAAKVEKIVFYAEPPEQGEQSHQPEHLGPGERPERAAPSAVVEVLADGMLVARNIEIRPGQRRHKVLVARPVNSLTFKALGGEGVLIDKVKVFGDWASGETRFVMTR